MGFQFAELLTWSTSELQNVMCGLEMKGMRRRAIARDRARDIRARGLSALSGT